jgi:hypothetical protein
MLNPIQSWLPARSLHRWQKRWESWAASSDFLSALCTSRCSASAKSKLSSCRESTSFFTRELPSGSELSSSFQRSDFQNQYASIRKAPKILCFPLQQWFVNKMEWFIHSLAFKTTKKKVQVTSSTSSCPMVPDLLKEKSIQLSILIWYQLMQSKVSDQSPCTTTMTTFKASLSLIGMMHYSGI